MLPSEDLNQTTDALETITQTTEALQSLPRTTHPRVLSRVTDRRTALNGRRQQMLERDTDALPQITIDPPGARVAWRQVIHLREENRHLRFALEQQQLEMQRIFNEYSALQTTYDKEIAVVHKGYQQEIEQYQNHLREMMEERNRAQETYLQMEQRYQILYHTFQDAVEEEARKMVVEATQTIELSPESVPTFLQDAVKTLEIRAREVEDKHLLEALYLKGEVQRMVEELTAERKSLDEERQKLFIMQHTAREQAELHQKTLQSRLYARWKFKSATTSVGLLVTLIVLQFLTLTLFHVPFVTAVAFAIFAPVVLCSLLAFVLARPLTMVKDIYESAPRKKKIKKQ
ncbi:MAG TPA: hypothetical protein VFB60_06715 [Ktedonobacteraceae bacterium]|nr:hypothetical protein [Ktedonobacteraceae bacterium]